MQINNIKIKPNKDWYVTQSGYGAHCPYWICVSPDGKILESFLNKNNAIKWAKKTLDYTEKYQKNRRIQIFKAIEKNRDKISQLE